MTKIYQPHDALFRIMMEHKEVAQEFFQSHLPQKVLEKIDLNHLEMQEETCISKDLRRSATDLLFQTTFSGQSDSVYLYILVEQQTQAEELMPFRMFYYLFKIMEKHLKKTKDKKLPLIFPVLFHNGKRKYPYSTDLLDCFNDPDRLMEEVLFKPIQLIDLSQIDDEVLQRKLHYGIMALSMKRVCTQYASELIRGLKEPIRKLEQKYSETMLTPLFNYIIGFAETKSPEETIDAIRETLTDQTREAVMSTLAQYWEKQGKEKGIQEGVLQGMEKGMEKEKHIIARNMLMKGLDIAVISETTGLSEREIQSLQIN